MNEIIAAGALSFIFIMTTLGAACVFFTEKCKRYEVLNGFAAGVMLAAAFWSLLLPAVDGARSAGQPPWVIVSVGVLCGVAFIALPDLFNRKTDGANRVFRAVTLHNIPEGMSVGVAFGTLGVSVAGAVGVALAIGLQNFPEGLATSLPFVEKKRAQKSLSFRYVKRGGRACFRCYRLTFGRIYRFCSAVYARVFRRCYGLCLHTRTHSRKLHKTRRSYRFLRRFYYNDVFRYIV